MYLYITRKNKKLYWATILDFMSALKSPNDYHFIDVIKALLYNQKY